MKQRKLLTMLAIVGSLALIASACSNDDDGGGGGGDTGRRPVREVDCNTVEFGCVEVASGEPITIGTLLSITGDTKNLGDSQHGIELALDYLDGTFDGEHGQIAGHDIDVRERRRRLLRRRRAAGRYHARGRPADRRRGRYDLLERLAGRGGHDHDRRGHRR